MKEIAKAILCDHQEEWQQIEAHFAEVASRVHISERGPAQRHDTQWKLARTSRVSCKASVCMMRI